MARPKRQKSESQLEWVLGEASWLLSHAEALADYGRTEEAAAELGRAANCAEQAAYLLDATGRAQEAAAQRVSAASCYADLGQYARATTLLRAALLAELPEEYRSRLSRQLSACLSQAA